MTWAGFYFICFVVGFALSALSFLSGGVRWHLHMPHHGLHGTGLHTGHGGTPAGHVAKGTGATGDASTFHVSPFNFVNFTAFLAWFGGTGYLLTRYSSVWFWMGLLLAILGGLIGASLVFAFLVKVLLRSEVEFEEPDEQMVGALGHICSPIREGGTGEMIFSQAGRRKTCGARSDNGTAMAKGSEVVVTRYEKGIAYVRLWDELANMDSLEGPTKVAAKSSNEEVES